MVLKRRDHFNVNLRLQISEKINGRANSNARYSKAKLEELAEFFADGT